jgi:hypothetical protein
MKSRSRLAVIIGGIAGASLFAFCCGLLLTVLVIVPAREGGIVLPGVIGEPTIVASPSVSDGPLALRTPIVPSPTPTYSLILATPTPSSSTILATPTGLGPGSTPSTSASTTPGQQPTSAPSPTPTPRFPFFYVQGSRVEELQCAHPYLQGWVRDADGAPLNGVTIQWQHWNNIEHAVSGDPQYVWQDGEFKFTYYGQNPHTETDFVLQVVESADNPGPLSEPLVIHYAGCSTTGQITNIVFKQR